MPLRSGRNWNWFATALCFLLATNAQAHVIMPGGGEITNGMLHPFIVPSHVLIIVGLGFLLGQHSPLKLKAPTIVFASVSAAALGLTAVGWVTTVPQPLIISVALVIGAIVALERRLPPFASIGLFGSAALLLGCDSPAETTKLSVVLQTLFGTWIAFNVLVIDLAVYVGQCNQKQWQKIGIRVVGSWIIAIAMLVLAFSLRHK